MIEGIDVNIYKDFPVSVFTMLGREICESDLAIFARKFKRKFNFDISGYKERFLISKIELFLEQQGYSSLEEGLMKIDDQQAKEFKEKLSIPTTEFFRDSSMFTLLQNKVLPTLKEYKQKNKSKILRIWSAGCSTGEETYSLAMTLHEYFGPELNNLIFSITGTDINENSLLLAKKGEYPYKKTEKIPSKLLNRHLDVGEKHVIKGHLRQQVRFQCHDLRQSAFATHFDLILYRNVSIYLSPKAQLNILQN